MFDQTNQAEELTVFENQEDGIAQAFIEGAMEEENTDVVPEEKSEEKFTVKYNGEEVELSLEELKTNAQKGMNYDHIKNELDTLKNSEHLRLVEDMAKNLGKNPAELVKEIQAGIVHREEERLRQNGAGDNAKNLMSANNEVNDFMKAFPGIDVKTIPTDVLKLRVESGIPLSAAYAKVMNARLLSELKVHEQNAKNARETVGSVLSEGACGQADPFLAGMMGY